jgi:uncharacterized damage-inducible protein DinB
MGEMKQREIVPYPAASEDLGRWLWALEDTRARTLSGLDGIEQPELDWTATGVENSIGTLLYHIALIECDYLSIDILGLDDYLEELKPMFPLPHRDADDRLSVMAGVPVERHLERLAAVRSRFLSDVAEFDREQLATARNLPEYGYAISPEWTLHHLMQHEAEHRGEIGTIRTLYRAATGG